MKSESRALKDIACVGTLDGDTGSISKVRGRAEIPS